MLDGRSASSARHRSSPTTSGGTSGRSGSATTSTRRSEPAQPVGDPVGGAAQPVAVALLRSEPCRTRPARRSRPADGRRRSGRTRRSRASGPPSTGRGTRLACAADRGRAARRPSRRPGRGEPRRSTRPTASSPTGSWLAGTEARAIGFLRIGLQPRLVTRPIWRPPPASKSGVWLRDDHRRGGRRQALGVVQRDDVVPARARARRADGAVRPGSVLGGEGALARRTRPCRGRPAGRARSRTASRPGPRSSRDGRSCSRPRAGSGPASSRTTSSAIIPAGRMPYGLPAADQRVPDVDRAIGRDPQLVAEIAGVAGPADVDRRSRRSSPAGAGSSAGRRTTRPAAASRTARLHGPWRATAASVSLMSSIVDVEPGRVHRQPAVLRVGRRPAEAVRGQPMDRAVVDDLAVLVAPRACSRRRRP